MNLSVPLLKICLFLFFKDGPVKPKRSSFIDQKFMEDLLEAKCNCNFSASKSVTSGSMGFGFDLYCMQCRQSPTIYQMVFWWNTNFATLSVALWVTLPNYLRGVAHSTFSEWGKLHFLLLLSNSVQNNNLPPSPYSLLLNISLCIFTPKGTEAVLEPLLLLPHVWKFCLAWRIYL